MNKKENFFEAAKTLFGGLICLVGFVAFVAIVVISLNKLVDYYCKTFSREGIVVARTHYESYDEIITQEKEHKTDGYTYTEFQHIPEHHPDKYELTIQYYDEDDEEYRYQDIYVDQEVFNTVPVGQKLIYRWDEKTIVKLLEVIDLNPVYLDDGFLMAEAN